MIKILLGGSPCTHWSIAQSKNRETEARGIGWELFKNYVIAKEKFKPDYFLYENNKSAAQPIKEQISKELGMPLQYINSALVSAQKRQRFYCHNIPGVEMPADRGVLLKDVLESGVDLSQNEKSYCLTASYCGAVAFNTIERGQRTMVAEPVNTTKEGKAQCLRASYYKDGIRNLVGNCIDKKTCIAEPVCLRYERTEEMKRIRKDYEAGNIHVGFNELRELQPRNDGKTNTLSTVLKDNLIAEPVNTTTLCANGGGGGAKTGLYAIPAQGKQPNIYEVKDGLITIKGKQYPIRLPDGFYIIRKLTVLECRRLQTVPEWYVMPCSNAQNYTMLGNGWTVEVIKHILSHIPNIQNEEAQVLSMYDGMSCGQIALKELGANVKKYWSTEIDKYAIQTTQANFPGTIQLGDAFQVREKGWGIE